MKNADPDLYREVKIEVGDETYRRDQGDKGAQALTAESGGDLVLGRERAGWPGLFVFDNENCLARCRLAGTDQAEALRPP